MKVTILTLNLKGLETEWHAQRRGLLLAQLAGRAPDVIALQEVGIVAEPFYHQALDLCRALSMISLSYAPYGNPAEVHSPEQGGVALLARWPLLLNENRRLPPGLRFPDNRVALLATVMQPEQPLHLAVTHLSWPPEEAPQRQQQLDTILARARDYGWLETPERFILAGDLNAPPADPGIAGLHANLKDVWSAAHPHDPGHTWSHTNPLTGNYPLPSRRLDYLFVDQRAQVDDARLLFNEAAKGFVSDHFGLWAELSWDDRLGPRGAGEQ
jgi:endonuclease/exonuclease/phosphatase family metal-dependent hydrolase